MVEERPIVSATSQDIVLSSSLLLLAKTNYPPRSAVSLRELSYLLEIVLVLVGEAVAGR